MGGVDIGMSEQVKLLGLIIDKGLTFNAHVANVCKKAVNIYKQLSRAARVGWGLHPEMVRTIYTAAVEPTILYAACAWAPSAQKLTVQKQFNTVQRGFAQKLCRAYRTVSLDSALLLAGMLPLDLRVGEVASLYEARKGVSHPMLGDREIERMSLATDLPHPAEGISIEFKLLANEEQYNATQNIQVRIFTDGSKIEGKVGAALSLWNGSAEAKALKLALPSYATVYQAELLALNRAAAEIKKQKATIFGIFCDSMAALQTVTNPDSPHPLAVDFRNQIKTCISQNKTINLYWIKAHVGLEGNERADELAKEAALGSKKRPDYDRCPVSFVKRLIRSRTIDEWDKRYRSGTTASITKLFFPSAAEAYRTVRKLHITSQTTQLTTGHGGFSAYLNRFKCKEDPSCICEPGVDETVVHVISGCPVFARERLELESRLGVEIVPKNFKALISGKDKTIFLEYCKKIINVVNKRNS